MIYLVGIVLIMLLALGLVALSYRGKAAAEQRHAELQQQRAASAEAVNQHRQQLDTTLAALHETQRQETINATNPTHLAARADFDNDWSAATGLHDTGTVPHPDRSSAAEADSAGATADNISRTDLSE